MGYASGPVRAFEVQDLHLSDAIASGSERVFAGTTRPKYNLMLCLMS